MEKERRKKSMSFDWKKFKAAYEKWVAESLPDFRAHKMDEIVKKYPFLTPEDVSWTPYKGKPSEQTFALVTTGGLYLKDSQPPFDTESIHGDISYREIPKTVRKEDLGIAHAHYDHRLAEEDFNTIFPVQRFIELEEEGIIGKLTPMNYSFSYVNDVVSLAAETIPKFIERIRTDGVDVLFLVPV
jgi:D-proline reductase (dithiol) PrdB